MKPTNDNRMVHKTVKAIARELAGTYYEFAASNGRHGNTFYMEFPNQGRFIAKQWRNFIVTAREIMVQMLGNPALQESYKQEIYHALLLDSTLPYSVQETQFGKPH